MKKDVKKEPKCVKCGEELNTTTLGMGDPFGFYTASPNYCENKKCEFFGVLTYAQKIED